MSIILARKFKAISLVTTVMLACALFVTIYQNYKSKKQEKEPCLIKEYGLENLKKAYPNWGPDNLYELLKETSDWQMTYEPFTCIMHEEKKGRFINYQKNFRKSYKNQTWPPNGTEKTIWVFGGSTVLGAGAPDWNTIPAFIEKKTKNKDLSVYNFGRGFYFSTQEKILFTQLLELNPKPRCAIFLHGLNDFYFENGIPEFTDQIDKVFQKDKKSILRNEREEKNDLIKAENVLKRLEVNRKQIKAICEAEQIIYLEIIQPVPLYKYPSSLFVFSDIKKHDYGRHYLHQIGYKLLNTKQEYTIKNKNLLNLSNLLEKSEVVAYCDAVHYTEESNRLIAEAIVSHLQEYYPEF